MYGVVFFSQVSENRILEPNPLAPTHFHTNSYHFFKVVEVEGKNRLLIGRTEILRNYRAQDRLFLSLKSFRPSTHKSQRLGGEYVFTRQLNVLTVVDGSL